MKFYERYPILVDIIAILGCSSSSLIIRQADAPSTVIALWRLILTVLFLSPVALGKKKFRSELKKLPAQSVKLSALSGVFLAIHFATWFEAVKHTSVASATVLVTTEVVWVAIGYRIFLKGRMGIKAVAAILVTLTGSILIAFSDSGAEGSNLLGDALALLAAIAMSVYTLLGRRVRVNTSTTVYTYIVYSFCCLVLGIITLVTGQPLMAGGSNTILAAFLLTVLCTFLGHSAYSWCLRYFSPAFVSLSKLGQPVAASIAAILLLGEWPTLMQLVGGVIVLAGVVYYSCLEIRKSHAARPDDKQPAGHR